MANQMQSGNDNPATPPAGVPIALKIFVISLGVMIIVMLLVLIYKVGFAPEDDTMAMQTGDVPVELVEGIAHYGIEVGTAVRVRSTEMDRGILTIVIETDDGDKVVIFDVKAKRVVAILDFEPVSKSQN